MDRSLPASCWLSFLQLHSEMDTSIVTANSSTSPAREDANSSLHSHAHFKPSARTTGHSPPDVLMFKTIQISGTSLFTLFMPLEHETERNPSHLFILNVNTGSRDSLFQYGTGLTSGLLLISHCLPHPCPLVIIPDLLFLKPYSLSSLYCSFTSRRLFEVIDSYFVLYCQHLVQCEPHCKSQ